MHTQALESALCARWWGVTLEYWDTLDGNEQARYIAAYRASNQMAAISATKRQEDRPKSGDL